MAKKKQAPAPVSNFDVGSFRRGEEASMATFQPTTAPVVDEKQFIEGRIAAAERAARTVIMPSAAELKTMSAAQKADLRNRIAANTAYQANKINETLSAAEKILTDIETARVASNKRIEEIKSEIATTSKEAETALAEGDKIVTGMVESGAVQYSDLPTVFQGAVNQQPQYKYAGIAAAIAALSALGVDNLVTVMEDIRKLYPDISSEDALALLKFDKRFNTPYMTRFAGNKMLMDAGFGPMDDKEYLATEKAFDKILISYGLKQFNNRDNFAKYIGNRISADELAARVSTAYDRVVMGAGETKQALKQLFPEISDTDVLAYALDPINQLPALQRKVQAAEIGGAALAQNLSIGMQAAPTQATGFTNVQREGLGIEQLQAQGVDLAAARKGYRDVAEVLPTAEKLSALYGARMEQYGRKQAEQEAFMNLASAKRARERLSETEIAQFQGSSGRGRTGKSVGGQI